MGGVSTVGGVSTGQWRSQEQEFHDPDLDDPSADRIYAVS